MEAPGTQQGSGRRNIVHAQLRERTAAAHDAVDASFGRFDLHDRGGYADFLRAHAQVLPDLEARLAPTDLIPGWVGRTDQLTADLTALDIPPPPAVPVELPASAAARWGALYVLEGSRLGGAVLARQVDPAFPHAYLSAVHGPGRWQHILSAIADAADGPCWIDQAVAGARAVFTAYLRAAGSPPSR